jgi:hypothetical protein
VGAASPLIRAVKDVKVGKNGKIILGLTNLVVLVISPSVMNKFICICLALGFLGACNHPDAPQKSFVDVAGIDSSIKPGDNFFRYVNGRWYDTAKIADDQTGVGSYSFMNIPQKRLLQNILDSVSKTQNTPGSIDQKVGGLLRFRHGHGNDQPARI